MLGAMLMENPPPFGDLLRSWRQRRRLSQLDLALEAEISARHLSFVETGRARPSREMVLRLAEHLDLPLRARNALLTAAGFAATFPERPLDSPELSAARAAVAQVLRAHAPFPALAVDRHWTLLAANEAVAPLLQGVSPALLAPPVNVLRLSLHPEGMAPRIENLGEWRGHILDRLRHQLAATGDASLANLLAELRALPGGGEEPAGDELAGIAVLLRLRDGQGRVLSFLSTTTVFGTARDVTLAELVLECFYPADQATRAALSAGAAP